MLAALQSYHLGECEDLDTSNARHVTMTLVLMNALPRSLYHTKSTTGSRCTPGYSCFCHYMFLPAKNI